MAKYLKDCESTDNEIIIEHSSDCDDVPVGTGNDERVQQKLQDLLDDDKSFCRPTLTVSQALPTHSDNAVFGDYIDHTTTARQKLALTVNTSCNEKIELVDISTPVNPPQSLRLHQDTPQLTEQTTPISSVQPMRQQVYSLASGDDHMPQQQLASNLFGSSASGYIDSAESPPTSSCLPHDGDIDILSTPISTLASLVDKNLQRPSQRSSEERPSSKLSVAAGMSESSGIMSPFGSTDSVFQSNTSDVLLPSNHQRRLSSGFPDTPDSSKPLAFTFPDQSDYIPDSTVLSNGFSTASKTSMSYNDARHVSLPSCTLSHISEEHSLEPSLNAPNYTQEPPCSDYIQNPMQPPSTTKVTCFKDNLRRFSLPVAPQPAVAPLPAVNPSILGLLYTKQPEENAATATVSAEVVADITSETYLPPRLPFSSTQLPATTPDVLSPRPNFLSLHSMQEDRRLSPLGQSSSSSSSMSSHGDSSFSLPSTSSSVEEFQSISTGLSPLLLSGSETNNNQYV